MDGNDLRSQLAVFFSKEGTRNEAQANIQKMINASEDYQLISRSRNSSRRNELMRQHVERLSQWWNAIRKFRRQKKDVDDLFTSIRLIPSAPSEQELMKFSYAIGQIEKTLRELTDCEDKKCRENIQFELTKTNVDTRTNPGQFDDFVRLVGGEGMEGVVFGDLPDELKTDRHVGRSNILPLTEWEYSRGEKLVVLAAVHDAFQLKDHQHTNRLVGEEFVQNSSCYAICLYIAGGWICETKGDELWIVSSWIAEFAARGTNGRHQPAKRGPKPTYDETADQRMFNKWRIARESGVHKKDFVRDEDIKLVDLDRLLDRVSKRKKRRFLSD